MLPIEELFEYQGTLFPDYLKRGNAARFITPVAERFCVGRGLDVGAGAWPLKGAQPIDIQNGSEAMDLPGFGWDYIFSSHCLEHLANPVAALEHWRSRLRAGGILFLYLPHPDMTYWRPENCRKHLHIFHPADVAKTISALGFSEVIHSERDMAWSFCVIGKAPKLWTK